MEKDRKIFRCLSEPFDDSPRGRITRDPADQMHLPTHSVNLGHPAKRIKQYILSFMQSTFAVHNEPPHVKDNLLFLNRWSHVVADRINRFRMSPPHPFNPLRGELGICGH